MCGSKHFPTPKIFLNTDERISAIRLAFPAKGGVLKFCNYAVEGCLKSSKIDFEKTARHDNIMT